MSKDIKIDIIGGGFSGLMQAFYLTEKGYNVRVFEKETKVGGLLGTKLDSPFLIEQGANAFLANKELERVASVIGVKLRPKKRKARKRYVYNNGEMSRWPLSLFESLPLAKFALMAKWGKDKLVASPDESLWDWGCRLLGASVTENLLEPGMQGVYATESKNLDAQLILDSLKKRPKKGKLRGSVAPEGGMGEWIEQTRKYLVENGCEFFLETEKENLNQNPTIFAVSLADMRSLVNSQRLDIPKSILETKSVSLTSVTLCFGKNKVAQKKDGFGCLFPKKESFNSLGVLFNNNIFKGRGGSHVSETWILNDDKMDFSHMSHTALIRYVMTDRYKLTGERVDPKKTYVYQWPGKIPLYDSALREFLVDLENDKSPYLFIGNYLGDLGLSKILLKARKNLKKIEGGHFG